MTTANGLIPGVGTFSPKAIVLSESEVVVKFPRRKVTKGAGAKLTHADFRRLAKTNPPPQTWYDETNG